MSNGAGLRGNRLGITVSVMLATTIYALDSTIANVALPHMQGGLNATRDQVSWMVTSFVVAMAIMTLPIGFLAQRYGRLRVFLVCIAGFTLASMACGAATSLVQMVFFRALQGACGAAMVPLSQAILLDVYPPEKVAAAMSIWGVGVMVGPVLGPVIGGWLTDTFSWRWVFYINLPLGLLAFVGIVAFLPESPSRPKSFDWFGFLSFGLAIGTFQLMLDRGETVGWFESTEVIIEAAISFLALYFFLVHLARAKDPIFPVAIFRDVNFSVSVLLMLIVGMVFLGSMVLMPLFLQQLRGLTVLDTGLLLAPRGLGMMATMMFAGRLTTRFDARALIALGMSLAVFAMWWMSGFNAEVDAWSVAWTSMLQGAGLGLVFVPTSAIAFATLSPQYRVQATGVYSLFRNIGGSVGIAITVAALARYASVNRAELGERLSIFSPWIRDAQTLMPWLPTGLQGSAMLENELMRQATLLAYVNDFLLMSIAGLIGLPLVLLLRRPSPPSLQPTG